MSNDFHEIQQLIKNANYLQQYEIIENDQMIFAHQFIHFLFSPLTPLSDHNRISPYNTIQNQADK